MNRPAASRSMSIDQVGRRPFRLGNALIDPVSRDASFPGGHDRLQPQTLKVLVALASRSGDVVTRDELIHLCWDGRIVGEDVINRSISLLRQFAERAGGFTIETIPRTGYRLSEETGELRRKAPWIAGMAVLSLAGLAAALWLNQPPIKQGLPPAPGITVLPFTAASNDAVARQAAQAASVSVAHMLSESGVPVVLADSAAARNANNPFVLSGNVRRAGAGLEATVELDESRSGRMAFSHDFAAPLAQAGDFPDQIGAAVSADLAWTGAEMALDQRRPLDPQVSSELMQAMTLIVEQHDSLRAYQILRHVAPLAPNSGIAQLSLAVDTGFTIDSIPLPQRPEAVAIARRASDRAEALAPDFGDVYIPWCLLHSPVRMVECDARLRKAERIDPSTSFAPGYLSSVLESAGRIEESFQLAQVSLANDPYKPAKLARAIRLDEAAGQSSDAEQSYREGTRLWPGSPRMRSGRLVGMAERGNYDGIARFADPGSDSAMLDASALTELAAARRDHQLPRARRACDVRDLKPFTQSVCMAVLADLGDLDRSFAIAAALYPAWLAPDGTDPDELWLEHPEGYATGVLAGPAGKSMRTDQRFLTLARKLGLLAYWRTDGLPDFCRGSQPESICTQLRRR